MGPGFRAGGGGQGAGYCERPHKDRSTRCVCPRGDSTISASMFRVRHRRRRNIQELHSFTVTLPFFSALLIFSSSLQRQAGLFAVTDNPTSVPRRRESRLELITSSEVSALLAVEHTTLNKVCVCVCWSHPPELQDEQSILRWRFEGRRR